MKLLIKHWFLVLIIVMTNLLTWTLGVVMLTTATYSDRGKSVIKNHSLNNGIL